MRLHLIMNTILHSTLLVSLAILITACENSSSDGQLSDEPSSGEETQPIDDDMSLSGINEVAGNSFLSIYSSLSLETTGDSLCGKT